MVYPFDTKKSENFRPIIDQPLSNRRIIPSVFKVHSSLRELRKAKEIEDGKNKFVKKNDSMSTFRQIKICRENRKQCVMSKSTNDRIRLIEMVRKLNVRDGLGVCLCEWTVAFLLNVEKNVA